MSPWRIIAVGPAQDGAWRDAAGAAQAVAARHDTGFDLILVGQGAGSLDAASWPSVRRVAVAVCEGLADTPAHCGTVAAAVLERSPEPILVILPAGVFGDEAAVALAQGIGARLLGQATDIWLNDARIEVKRQAFGGRMELTLDYPAGLCVATMRASQPAASGKMVTPEVLDVVCDLPAEPVTERVPLTDRKPSLEGASLVVTGGRGLDAAGFAKLEDIAQALGGVVGASLPAVDLGLAPVSRQVGQSGKFVTPKLYLGVGVSGTLQHLAGIGAATPIVAVNSDPDAAIFRYAELGVVADAREFLPMLIDELNATNVRTLP